MYISFSLLPAFLTLPATAHPFQSPAARDQRSNSWGELPGPQAVKHDDMHNESPVIKGSQVNYRSSS